MPQVVVGQSGKPVEVATVSDITSDTPSVPVATSSTAGIVKVGTNLSVTDDGTLSVPLATGAKAGAIMIGSGLAYSPSTGLMSVASAASNVTGGVKQGVAVASAAGDTPTKAEFDALLTSLRNSGVLASS